MKKPILNFQVGDKIIVKEPKKISQVLTIDYINYVDKTYVFKEPWINSLSQFNSLDFDKVHETFKLQKLWKLSPLSVS